MREQCSKRGLSCAEWRGIITSPGLQASLLLMKSSTESVSSVQGHTTYSCSTFFAHQELSASAKMLLSSQHSTYTVARGYFISDMMASEAGHWPHQQKAQSHSTQPGRAQRIPGGNQAEVAIQWSPNRFLLMTQIQEE